MSSKSSRPRLKRPGPINNASTSRNFVLNIPPETKKNIRHRRVHARHLFKDSSTAETKQIDTSYIRDHSVHRRNEKNYTQYCSRIPVRPNTDRRTWEKETTTTTLIGRSAAKFLSKNKPPKSFNMIQFALYGGNSLLIQR